MDGLEGVVLLNNRTNFAFCKRCHQHLHCNVPSGKLLQVHMHAWNQNFDSYNLMSEIFGNVILPLCFTVNFLNCNDHICSLYI
jgi:hypothetical protein